MKKTDGQKRPTYVNARSKRSEADLPESDAAYSIVSGIIAVVPASQWTFARVEASGSVISVFGSKVEASLPSLSDEFRRQRAMAASGPRIAAAMGSLEGFTSGITLLFADVRMNYGILSVLRAADIGPFTSSEISMLTFALDAVTDHLAALRLQPPSNDMREIERFEALRPPERPVGAFYVLDRDLNIVLAWSAEEERRVALTGLHTRVAQRLPRVLEESVGELTSEWSDGAPNPPGTARPVSFLVLRTQPMSGPAGLFIGVRIDRYRAPNSLTGIAARFKITPREVQVLALLLDGSHLDQIASKLYITSSTVQDHIKSMMEKTESGNRSELIARILGWEHAPVAP